MKHRIALLLFALAALLSVSAYAASETVPGAEEIPAVSEAAAGGETALPSGEMPDEEVPAALGNALSTPASPFVRTQVYDNSFADVSEQDWFYSAVAAVYEYALINGYGEGLYMPEGDVTVAELLTLSARLHSTYYSGGEAVGFAAAGDSEPWYAPYVSYLQEQGILVEDLTSYDAAATRAQMAAVFAASLPEKCYDDRNADFVANAYASRDFITDVNDYTPYQPQILWMYKQGLLTGTDAVGSFLPNKPVSRAEIAALLTRMVDPALRVTPDWVVLPYHSAVGATLAGLVKAPAESSIAPNIQNAAEVERCVRKMLSAGSNKLVLSYTSMNEESAGALAKAFVSSVKSYCEQMYNQVNISYTLSGRAYLTFSSTACSDEQLQSYRERTIAAAIAVHDALWENGSLDYSMSQYDIAQVYFNWLCEHCVYAADAGDASLSHLAYNALLNGSAVCDGYTGAYNLLLKLEGIECSALFNDSHIWTVAKLDGVRYHIDTTWGDQYGRIDNSCFGMTEEQSRAKHDWIGK